MHRSLREGNSRRLIAGDLEKESTLGLHRSTTNFLMQGKFKCSVVDVNPDLSSASKHSRTISDSAVNQDRRKILVDTEEYMPFYEEKAIDDC